MRVSFNSFVPNSLDEDLAEKLVNYYLEKLIERPALHDKVEFDIVISCFTPQTNSQLTHLEKFGFKKRECSQIAECLRLLTNSIIKKTVLEKDLERIEVLKSRQDTVMSGDLEPEEKVYWLIEDCKRYGTLPFAGLRGWICCNANAAIIGRHENYQSKEREQFLLSIDTVSSQMTEDFNSLSKDEFLEFMAICGQEHTICGRQDMMRLLTITLIGVQRNLHRPT